jgi:hypothetical protein
VKRFERQLLVCCALACATIAQADPWLAPGDEGLRSDILLLADADVLRGPVTTWPLSWPDVARDALAVSPSDLRDDGVREALLRVQRLARHASSNGYAGAGARIAGAHEPGVFRGFAHQPREEGELTLRASWLQNHFAVNLQATVVADPDDGKKYRADGSYLGINIGNFMLSAGLMDRWWGPGHEGSLILSTNARPIPTLTLERNYTDPFRSRWLSWIGPWRASIAVGEAESNEVAVADVRFLAARVNFKPRPWLEFGLTRTAQFCGGSRECDLDTVVDLVLGRDNQVENGAATDDQPGNQMAGYDFRMRSPWRKLPFAVYGQFVGEDEAGGLPSKFLGLYGMEGWWSTSMGGVRAHLEVAETTCNFSRKSPEYDCAYRNALYPQGYTYRGRGIGHSMDNDSLMLSVGGVLSRPNGDVLSLTLRRIELNRDGGANAISPVPTDVDNVELRYTADRSFGRISVGVGYDQGYENRQVTNPGDEFRGFLVWQQGL